MGYNNCSSEVKLQKPDERIFQYAKEQSGVNKEHILFIDNTLAHIEAAKKFGMQIFHYDVSDPENSSKKLLLFFNTSHT